MALIPGSNIWEDNVYLVETTDAVEGGPLGKANEGVVDLANRTQYLKKHRIGEIIMFGAPTPPNDCLNCDGAELDRAGTYSDLFAVIGTRFGKRVEFDDAFPNNFVKITSHGFTTGDTVNIENFSLSSTTITFPGSVTVTPSTQCFVRVIDSNTFSLHPTLTDANNNTNAATIQALVITGNLVVVEYDTKFKLPDFNEKTPIGFNNSPLQGDAVGRSVQRYQDSLFDLVSLSLNFCIKYR